LICGISEICEKINTTDMKKQFFQSVITYTLGTFLFIFVLVGCKLKDDAGKERSVSIDETMAVPALFERQGELAKAGEWEKTKMKVAELNQKIAAKPSDIKSRLQLATIFLAEARITGEHPYYYPAAIRILDGVLALDPKNFEALVYKASVKLSQHQFAEAKMLAEKARDVNPDNAYVYGVLVDANVELGSYEEAIRMSDKMQSIKPSLESYSRASYLREIHGDYPGAIEAMRMAVQAGLPGSEPQCWSKKTLGQLYEKTGKWKQAEKEYAEILAMRPSYAFALEGMARIEKQRKNYDAAQALLEQAAAIMPEFSFYEELADIYMERGDREKAMEQYEKVIDMLREDEQSGHTVSLELGRVYGRMGKHDKALEYVAREYEGRPLNIDVNQALAWVHYNLQQNDKATQYIRVAMKTGSKDPELLQRASLIQKKAS
jgi:tetratricopeptide (TPR) repeat protein